MKKILSVLAIAVSLALASCTPASKLEFAVRVAAADCPMEVDELTKITDIVTEGKNVVYKCELDEEQLDVNLEEIDNPEFREAMKEVMLNALKSSAQEDESTEELFKLCKDADYNIIYRYIGSLSDYNIDVVIYTHEL